MITNKDFVHLHLHTNYSILDGMIKIDNLINKVKEFGSVGVAITDHGSISGAIEFYDKCKANGINPIIGAELYITEDRKIKNKSTNEEDYKISGYHLLLLAKDLKGYKNLVKLVTIGNLEGYYYKPRIDKEVLAKYSEGLIMLSGCLASELSNAILYQQDQNKIKKILEEYLSIFGKENFFLEFQYHGLEEQVKLNTELIKIARKYGLKRVITNDSHYLSREDYFAHDVLLCIQTKKKIDDPKRLRFTQNEFYLKSAQELYEIWKDDFKDAFFNTRFISEMVNITFPENIYYLPRSENSSIILRELCYKNLPLKYPNYDQRIIDRLEYELKVIEDMGFSDYFLIVWDFINWAKSKNIPVGPGRGSVGGSITAYIIGITQIDPLKYGLLFERFLNPGRKSMPDIDTDFCQLKRDLVIDYCIEKYGRTKVSNIGTFGRMKARAAVRDVARVLGLPPSWADRIAKMIPFNNSISEAIEQNSELKKEYHNDNEAKKVLNIAINLEGNIRNQSVHAAGVIISSIDIDEMIPLTRVNDVIATAYDMTAVERLGFVKMDFLGLRTLTLIDDVIKLIKKTENVEMDVYNLRLDDDKTYQLLREGDTVGVFQTESPGFANLLRELKPSNINDIISALALYRPGPLESGLVKNFIESKHDPSKIEYLHPDLEDILKETYGIIVYQEQIMMIANKFANFTLAQADDLRKAMGKKKPEIMEKYRQVFIEGCVNNGYPKELAEKLFDIIEKFAGYGFNKSHSTAYGILTYITAFLKANYPHEYLTGLLRSVEDNPKKLKVFLKECNEKGIKVLPPDINKSNKSFDIEFINSQKFIRYGFMGIKGLGEAVVNEIISKRNKPFGSIYEFSKIVNHRVVNKKAFEILILSGCFDNLYPDRMELFGKLEEIIGRSKNKTSSLFVSDQIFSGKVSTENYQDKKIDPLEILKLEREYLGVYLSDHPLNKLDFKNLKYKNIKEAKKERLKNVELIGAIVNLQEKITSKGRMAIFELDDPTDSIEVVVYTSTYQEYREKIKEGNIVVIKGEMISDHEEENEEEFRIICSSVLEPTQKTNQTESSSKYILNFFVEVDNNFPEEKYYRFLDVITNFFYDQGEIKINFEIYQADRYKNIPKDKFVSWQDYYTIINILKNDFPEITKKLQLILEEEIW
ncbi:MAG: DNA polymerase III subunit alpha [bacterium]